MSNPFFLCLLNTGEKLSVSYSFSTANIVPIGNDILLLGVMEYVLSFVCMLDNTKQTKDTYIIKTVKLGIYHRSIYLISSKPPIL